METEDLCAQSEEQEDLNDKLIERVRSEGMLAADFPSSVGRVSALVVSGQIQQQHPVIKLKMVARH